MIQIERETCEGLLRWRMAAAMLLAIFCAVSPAAAESPLDDGNLAWNARAEQREGRLARPGRIEQSIEAYRAAARADATDLEARWKLLRALHFLTEFTTATEERKGAAVDEAVSSAEDWIEIFQNNDIDDNDRAQLHFWAAIAWGARAQRIGLLTIVRQGVANKLHDYALRAVELSPDLERGGGYRLLSRLHATLPRVPFISSWVDRDQVLPLAEKAFAIDRDDPGNSVILALALLEHAPERRAEAISLLESVTDRQPRPELLAEDLAIREQARNKLADIRDLSSAGEV